MQFTIHAKLVAIQEGQYTLYVFENLLEQDNSLEKFVMTVRLPNWQYERELQVGDVGYVTCDHVEAGDTYYDRFTDDDKKYKFTSTYFLSFIKAEKQSNSIEFKF